MPTWSLYGICIFIWGTTWYVLTFQLGTVPIELSIAYRFALGSGVSFFILFFKKKLYRYGLKDHTLMALQGILMYGAGYILVYEAGHKVTSAINAVLFSTIIFFNCLLASLYFKRPLHKKLVLGALLTCLGVWCFFLPQVQGASLSSNAYRGAGEILLAVFLTSCGNIVAERVHEREIPVFENNAYAMLYGALFSLVVSKVQGQPLTFDTSFSYWGSLVYLSVFGSIITFGAYLTLLRRMGSEAVALPLITIPMVSLVVSHLFERYQLSLWSFIGIISVMGGNYVALRTRQI